jgi:hypothetical protein
VFVVRQHRAGLKPHQRGDQAGGEIEQQRLGLAAGSVTASMAMLRYNVLI